MAMLLLGSFSESRVPFEKAQQTSVPIFIFRTPAFIAAFTSRKSLSTKELTEIKKLLASLEEARL